MYNPVSTYRIQFHKGFTLENLEQVMEYLSGLGISTLYASPIFKSVPGSIHGYDALDAHSIDPEIGTEEQFKSVSSQLHVREIGWLQDIVPNHMAFDPRNRWLGDVMRNGRDSVYASYFDIDWNDPSIPGKLMVPFLGTTKEEAVHNGELKLVFRDDAFQFQYYDALYPCNDNSVTRIKERLKASADDWPLHHQLHELEKLNENKELLLELLDLQHYSFCHWKETESHINYRRFFTVNGLICLNMQDEKVFEDFHRFIFQLLDGGIIDGLRIDHVDGLYDPAQYLERLKTRSGSTYTVIEKILQKGEDLPSSWKTEGTTGYDFLAAVNSLFNNQQNQDLLLQFYNNFTPTYRSFEQQLRDKKRFILFHHMQGELDNLVGLFLSLQVFHQSKLNAVSPDEIKNAIGEFLVHCPVYRYYGNQLPLSEYEAESLQQLFEKISQTEKELAPAMELFSRALLKEPGEDALYFYQRCMQFSGPLMAKGFEDTLMYTYNYFIAHNEVGDSPGLPGGSIEAFHQAMEYRQHQWPLTMNTTSTHDTKRGEDVRARLQVISDIAPLWIQQVEEWLVQHKELQEQGTPVANDVYLIYQSIIGHYPMPGEDGDDFENRMEQFLQKAMREAKLYSSWTEPNEAYEAAAVRFARSLVDHNQSYFNSFQKLLEKIVDHGIINSLVQLLIKCTAPGIPDIYQGTELWDLSFVDPDNRRPVDYQKRIRFLEEIRIHENKDSLFSELWNERYSGKIKLWLTEQVLLLRKNHATLFSEGQYIPLAVQGKFKDHVVAFGRRHRQQLFIIAAPLHTATVFDVKSFTEFDWDNTEILLPADVLPSATSVLTKQLIHLPGAIRVNEIFRQLPFALIKADVLPNEREAGILLALSSLPSRFGIGDIGPEAYHFVDFLYRTNQSYWQLLPLNPTDAAHGHSPYSSSSSMAGNILLISPEWLVKQGLLEQDLSAFYLPSSDKADYKEAEKIKTKLFDLAWQSWKNKEDDLMRTGFEDFCEKEKSWLEDFACFIILKQKFQRSSWNEWPEVYKKREVQSIIQLKRDHEEAFRKIQWLQFIFHRQWMDLKNYCHEKGIRLIGDIPFYVSYDSSDVWAHPQLFRLDEEGECKFVAGVPPDAFSEDGQLWGMPIYRWNVLKQTGYRWWIDRLKKNMELFDLVRLDHFRAFSAYWEVPADEDTARKGKWTRGPGIHFFRVLKKELGALPFIAEDLGDIDEAVYSLRDQFFFPGMKVLQFAFGNNTGTSPHAPHNYDKNFIVYSGTHDNNTTRGWWKEGGKAAGAYLEQYTGRKINEDEVSDIVCRLAYSSTARMVILPLQDILDLDEKARMNLPAATSGNWLWRLLPGQLSNEEERKLKEWTEIYNRK